MRLLTMLDNVAVDTDGAVIYSQNYPHMEYGVFQAYLNGSGTVQLQGRTSSAMPWVTIDSFTASDASRVSLFPEMRARVTGLTGTCRCEMAI